MAFRIAILSAIALITVAFLSTHAGREWLARRLDELRAFLP